MTKPPTESTSVTRATDKTFTIDAADQPIAVTDQSSQVYGYVVVERDLKYPDVIVVYRHSTDVQAAYDRAARLAPDIAHIVCELRAVSE